jgi:glycosyltransferase involved in cell wall biosynthesis
MVLACTGPTDDYRNPRHLERLRAFLDEHGLDEYVRILGVVPRADYIQLIRAAALVVQPSRYEGWSSVVEDARALGKRMVLSDIAVHVEQAPRGALYFRTGDPTDLAQRLIEGLELAPALDEHEALARQAGRITTYARTFEGIAREAVEAG